MRRLSWWLALATLALLPYEFWLPMFPIGRFTITSLEAVWMAAIAVWLGTLIVDRRRPKVPRVLVIGFAIVLVIGLISAAIADGYNSDAFVFVGRSAAGWLLCLAIVDQIRARLSLA